MVCDTGPLNPRRSTPTSAILAPPRLRRRKLSLRHRHRCIQAATQGRTFHDGTPICTPSGFAARRTRHRHQRMRSPLHIGAGFAVPSCGTAGPRFASDGCGRELHGRSAGMPRQDPTDFQVDLCQPARKAPRTSRQEPLPSDAADSSGVLCGVLRGRVHCARHPPRHGHGGCVALRRYRPHADVGQKQPCPRARALQHPLGLAPETEPSR